MTTERIKMVKAMEFLARQVNNEDTFYEWWLTLGVPDGDINYGDLSDHDDDGILDSYYANDKSFAELMDTFLTVMAFARKNGGLYCDNVTST